MFYRIPNVNMPKSAASSVLEIHFFSPLWSLVKVIIKEQDWENYKILRNSQTW